jgi:hypothetical protein
MSYSYLRTERLILDAVDRRILRRATISDRIVSALGDTDVLVVAAFCVIGLLATVAAILMVPSFGEFPQVLQQLP